jgi:hypothetical protein
MTNVTYHGDSFIEVEHTGVRLFVDPTFSRVRRGRRSRSETRPCDYVLVSALTESFDDALDVLEDHEQACLVGSDAVCREARRELRLPRDRTFDLEDFERASDGPIRITAIPLTRPTPASSGLAFMEGIGESVNAEVSRMLARTPLSGLPTRGLRQLGMLPMMGRGMGMNIPTRGEPANGFLLQLGTQSVALFGQGIHDGTDERDLEDVASLGPIDTLLIEAVSSVGAVVRATRILEPREVLVYRGHDPYGRGRRALAMSGADVPLRSYVEAIQDDADGVEAKVLKPGASVALRATENGRAAAEAPRN